MQGAEAILRLRAVIDNGDFEAYWAFTCAASMTASPGGCQDRYDLAA